MNDQPTPSTTSGQSEERQTPRHGGREWILGIILILVAGLLYLQSQKIYTLHNWWALFILIPALGSFAEAWWLYRSVGGKFSRRVRGSLIFGIGLCLVTVIFLFELSWVVYGPLLLALAGLSLILNGIFSE